LTYLALPNLLLQGVATDVNIDVQFVALEDLLHLLSIIVDRGHDGHNQDLARAHPERPLAGKVLSQDSCKTRQLSCERTNLELVFSPSDLSKLPMIAR
jgi:hypothetical protein